MILKSPLRVMTNPWVKNCLHYRTHILFSQDENRVISELTKPPNGLPLCGVTNITKLALQGRAAITRCTSRNRHSAGHLCIPQTAADAENQSLHIGRWLPSGRSLFPGVIYSPAIPRHTQPGD